MISEDWSNDAENSALITTINYILKVYKNRNPLFYIVIIYFTILLFLSCIFNQLNAALMSRRDFLKKNIKNLTDPKLLKGSVYI